MLKYMWTLKIKSTNGNGPAQAKLAWSNSQNFENEAIHTLILWKTVDETKKPTRVCMFYVLTLLERYSLKF